MTAVLAESLVGVGPSAAGRFEVGYVTEDGAEHRVRLDAKSRFWLRATLRSPDLPAPCRSVRPGLISPVEGDVPPAGPGRMLTSWGAGHARLRLPDPRRRRSLSEALPAWARGLSGARAGRDAPPDCRAPHPQRRPAPWRRRHRADSLSGPAGHHAHPHRSTQRHDARHPRLGAGDAVPLIFQEGRAGA